MHTSTTNLLHLQDSLMLNPKKRGKGFVCDASIMDVCETERDGDVLGSGWSLDRYVAKRAGHRDPLWRKHYVIL